MDTFQFLQLFQTSQSKQIDSKLQPIKVKNSNINQQQIQNQIVQQSQETKLHKPSLYGYFLPYTELINVKNEKQTFELVEKTQEVNHQKQELMQINENFNFHVMQDIFFNSETIQRKITFIEQQKKVLACPSQLYAFFNPIDHLNAEFFSKKFLNLGTPYKV